MEISIGAAVMGTSGKLGEVRRVIVDPRTGQVSALVVRHGFLFGGERVVLLEDVRRIEEGVIYLDLDEQGFADLDDFSPDQYRVPDPDIEGPAGFDRSEFVMDTLVAGAAAGGNMAAPPAAAAPGDQAAPESLRAAVVAPGMEVRDVDGEKVGEVDDISLAPDTGAR